MKVSPTGLKKFNLPLFYAVLAMSYFRGRNRVRPVYRNARPGSSRSREIISGRSSSVSMARMYIRLARLNGFRGSVFEALLENDRRLKELGLSISRRRS